MSIESDLADIDAAILAQRIGHLAASARAAQSQIQPHGYQSRPLSATGRVLEARGMRQVPSPLSALSEDSSPILPWWHHPWVARAQRVDLIAGLCVGAAGMVIHLLAVAIDSAAGRVGLSAPALIVAVAGGVMLVPMLCRGGRSGGGKRISGTFEGRLH